MTEKSYKTEQEQFWAGAFGDAYVERNRGGSLLASNLAFFTKVLRRVDAPATCMEFGANIGMNLKALKLLLPNAEFSAVEINAKAAEQLEAVIPRERIHSQSILDFDPSRQWELVLSKGVLIHINPDELPAVYDKLVESTSRYLLIAAYYNPTPVTIRYRGHEGRLFKRDFAGELMNRHPQLTLKDYGFVYHRDPTFPQDDMTWFLLEKR